MTFHAIILTIITALAPPDDLEENDTSTDLSASASFDERLHAVDVTVSDADVVIDALDQRGETIGSLAMWVDARDVAWFAADFGDGYAVFGIELNRGEEGGGEVVYQEASLDLAIVTKRLEIMQAITADNSWGECGWKAAGAAIGCALARPFACVGGAIKAACACVPKIVKENPPIECPWGL